ncbi:MAG: hypothetical protein M1821_001262 [Bathelium mastoideum]|nr:MAG: hypothetical protein M1821_001262 [Bathelium mastoideum]
MSAPSEETMVPSNNSSDEEAPQIREEKLASPPDNIIDWDGPDDPKNPMNWPMSLRWLQIAIISLLTFTTPLASSMFAPGIGLLDQQFHNRSDVLSALVLSVYLLGFVFGPFVAAPLSETIGRLPVYHGGNLLFVVFSVACGVSSNLSMLIGFRFLMGTFGCVPVTLGGGTVADIMPPLKRGKAINLWSLGPALGPIIGPACGGWLSERVSWRWNFYVIAIFQGAIAFVAVFVLRESYAPTLLYRKTKRLRKETGNDKLEPKLESNVSTAQRFKMAILRPSRMLMTPIVAVLCIQVALIYAYVYLLFSIFTQAFVEIHGFSVGLSGLTYLGLGVGLMAALFGQVMYSDRYVGKKSAKGEMKPEYRLPPLVIGTLLLPIGLFWYGWSMRGNVYWLVPVIGTVPIGAGLILNLVPVQTYFVDAYTRYAASAIAANTIVRSLVGGVLPLAGQPMYTKLGYGWGSSLLAFIALALAPLSWLIVRYGERLRTNPRYAVEF